MAHRILVIDSQSEVRSQLFRSFSKEGFDVLTANHPEELSAKQALKDFFPFIIADIETPLLFKFIQEIKEKFPKTKLITIHSPEDTNASTLASRVGSSFFTLKPIYPNTLIPVLKKHLSLQKENVQKTIKETKQTTRPIIGDSTEIQKVLQLVQCVAPSDSTVLITGESGTGKELIARAIHQKSKRAEQPFIPINCGAIPAELLESELFGHVKGAFTGAIANRPGRFELAHGGTIFLDEIGDMSPALQVKLLRVLQEQSFEAIGSTKTTQVDIRVIAATHIDLEQAVTQGRFREDLFYRLNVIPIVTPSLRERKVDIPLLLNHFVRLFNEKKESRLNGFSPQSLETLNHYKWPGNIRELENLVERLSILKQKGEVQLSDLPEKYRESLPSASKNQGHQIEISDEGMDFNSSVEKYENTLILAALEKTRWNRNQAAILLGLNRTTLVEKIKKKALQPSC